MGLFKPDSPEKVAAKVTPVAQQAWDTGQRYFTPALTLNAGLQANAHGTIDVEWARQLEAIEAVGWKLHTWQTAVIVNADASNQNLGTVAAHPLFVRPA